MHVAFKPKNSTQPDEFDWSFEAVSFKTALVATFYADSPLEMRVVMLEEVYWSLWHHKPLKIM